MATDFEQLANDWIAAEGRYSAAWEELYRLVSSDPEQALQVILEINSQITRGEPRLKILASLAAGPMEDLLVRHGSRVIEKVEIQARIDPSLRMCLGGVWQNTMSDELFERVQKYADHSWDFT